jgi:hypothetical protein
MTIMARLAWIILVLLCTQHGEGGEIKYEEGESGNVNVGKGELFIETISQADYSYRLVLIPWKNAAQFLQQLQGYRFSFLSFHQVPIIVGWPEAV